MELKLNEHLVLTCAHICFLLSTRAVNQNPKYQMEIQHVQKNPSAIYCTSSPTPQSTLYCGSLRYTVQQNLPYAKWLGSGPSELLLSNSAEICVKGKLQPERVKIV